MTHRRRRFRIVRPSLQWRLILSFAGISALALLLQYILFVRAALAIVGEIGDAGTTPLSRVGWDLIVVLGISFLVMLPLTVIVGVLVTHKIAGPVYRFETYLKSVIGGEKPADCRLRKGDELQELCTLINRATEPMRRASATPTAPTTVVGPEHDLAA